MDWLLSSAAEMCSRSGGHDSVMGELLDPLAMDEFELFLVQAWLFGIKEVWWFMVGSSKSPVL